MMSINELRGTRSAKAKAMADLVAKPKWDAANDQPVYDALMAEHEELSGRITRNEDMNRLAASEGNLHAIADGAARIGHNSGADGKAIYAKWLRGGENSLSAEDFAHIRNTMSTTTDTQGGFTVATEVSRSVSEAMKAYGGMRSVSTVIQTSGIGPLSYPTSDGTSETGEWIAENTTSTDLDIAFGTKALTTFKASSKVITIPFELLQDSMVDVEALVRDRLATRLGRITNTGFTTGTGTGQPNGVITAATTGVTAANASSQVTAVIYDSLVNLIHSVDPAYRQLGNCKFMMNDASVKVIRQIKDNSLRPIFVPGYENTQGGTPFAAPDTLMGYPIVINQDIAVMAAGAKSIAFGDFSYYLIRDVMNMEMFRFTDSAFVKKGQIGFLAWLRAGGNLVDVGGAVKLFVNAAS